MSNLFIIIFDDTRGFGICFFIMSSKIGIKVLKSKVISIYKRNLLVENLSSTWKNMHSLEKEIIEPFT